MDTVRGDPPESPSVGDASAGAGGSWLSFVPSYVGRDLLAHPGASPVERMHHMEVVALFADISGFTPMSEALGAAGAAGTEELAQVLNAYFDPMIDLVHSHGGIIAKFAGDAMTIVFPHHSTSRAAVARRATRCALEMQRAMARYAAIQTAAGTFSLAMKAGLAMGGVLWTTVGDAAMRYEHVIAGRALDLCAEAEHHAGPGEVVVHADLWPYLQEASVVEQRGHFRAVAGLRQHASRRPTAPDESAALTAPVRAALAPYLHPAVARRLQENQRGFIDEHRKVTVVFGGFSGFDYDADPDVGAKLQEYLLAVLGVIARYDGYLRGIDMGDKGSMFVLLFGAPIAHEDDEERALRCALELSGLPHCAVRFGVNTGRVYCGVIGSRWRQDYAAIGDAVNLAARLMQAAAPGQVLASGGTQRYVLDAFSWQSREPIRVKGKSGLIPVAEPRGVREGPALRAGEPTQALPMVGREAELRLAADKIALAARGRGQIIGVSGEAGLGKSRLGAEIVRLGLAQGLTVYGGACHSYGLTTSYLGWRDLWRGFFGLDPSWAPERQRAQLATQLELLDPDLTPRMPLLDVLLNISLPDNAVTRSFDAQLRKESLEALLLDCLGRRARQTPLLLMLEDCHWIDPLSHDLLDYLGRNLAGLPVLLLVLYRAPFASGDREPRLARLAHFSACRLAEFTPDEAERMIRLTLAQQRDGDGVPAGLTERIQEKAQGNPFYIEEMLNLLRDRGIDPRDRQALDHLQLPESLHSLIISRLDQLMEEEKSALKVASVIGRQFRPAWLHRAYPPLGGAEHVQIHLDTLNAVDLIRLATPEPDVAYLFKHVVTQEVAYESMAIATRATLHDQVGGVVEQLYADRLDRYVDVLAFHYGRSRNSEKQRTYFRLAGDAARAAYANEVAIDYYQLLLPLLPPEEQGEVLCGLGQVWQLIGRWSEAEGVYRQALGLAESMGDGQARARCHLLLGHLMWYKAAYPEALEMLEQAQAGFERSGDQHGLSQASGRLGLVHRLHGDYARALSCFEQQARIATALGERDDAADAFGNMGTVYAERDEHAQALECYERQLALAAEAGNQRQSLYATGNIGELSHRMGDYARALDNYGQALDAATRIGDRHSATIAAINIGEVYRVQGDVTPALAGYQHALASAVELDDRTAALVAVSNIAQTYLEQGRLDESERLFARAIVLGRALDLPYWLVDALYGQAELYALQRRYAEAQAATGETLEVATRIERHDMQFKALLLSLELRVARDQTAQATAIGEYEALLDRWPEPSERAATCYALWRLTGSEDRRREAATLYSDLYAHSPSAEYRRRLEDLGGEPVADPPPLPPLPEALRRPPVPLEVLLAHVDTLMAATQAAPEPAYASP